MLKEDEIGIPMDIGKIPKQELSFATYLTADYTDYAD
jgi:hypothetical protein